MTQQVKALATKGWQYEFNPQNLRKSVDGEN